ncbi:MAG: SDR family NAD(P)-dependent oxidoreductase [Caulobacteraceae bacterium]
MDQKVAWVTGASSGIGEALVKALVKSGWSVILSGRRVSALEAVAKTAGGETMILPFEVTDFAALPGIAETALAWKGRIDLLINNAGVSQRSLALDTDFETYQRIMDIDYFAPLRLTQLVLPHMVDRGSGTFVAISSLAGRIGSCMRTGYCSAKFALLGYYEALRAEVDAAYGVKVLTVLPGSVRTAVAANALQGDGSQRGVSDANIDGGMDPDDVARQIVAAIKTGKRDLVIAEGGEMGAYQMRMSDPERLYDGVAREGVRMAAQRAAAGEGQALILDPSRNR